MTHKHKPTFGKRAHSEREKRLLFEVDKVREDADALRGLGPGNELYEMLNTNEQQREHWKNIEWFLDRAVKKSGNAQLQELWKSQELRRWIMAQVKQNPVDGTLTWLSTVAQKHAERFEQTAETEAEQFQQINLDVTKAVSVIVEAMKAGIDNLREQRDKRGAGGVALPPLPAGVDIDALMKILEKFDGDDEERLKTRQHALVAVARVVKYSEEAAMRQAITASLEGWGTKIDAVFHQDVLNGLLKILDDGAIRTFVDKQQQMLEFLKGKGDLDLSAEDRATLQKAIETLETELATLDQDQKIILEGAFAAHTRYLRNLAGDKHDEAIRYAVRDDYKFSPELFIASVRAIKPDITDIQVTALKSKVTFTVDIDKLKTAAAKYAINLDAEVQAKAKELGIDAATAEELLTNLGNAFLKKLLTEGKNATRAAYGPLIDLVEKKTKITFDNFSDELINVWDTSKIVAYLENDLHLTEGVGYSFRRLALRARLPKEAADFIINGDVQISVSDMVALSQIETFVEGADNKLSAGTVKELIKRIAVTNGARREIEKEHFIDVISFVLLRKKNDDGADFANAAESATDARKKATDLWDSLVTAGIVTDGGAGIFVLPDEKKLEDELKKQKGGDKAGELIKGMHDAKLYELTWAQSSKQYVKQFLDDMWVAGGEWVDYLKNLGVVVTAPGAGRMEEIIRQRDRLKSIKGTLENTLALIDGSDDMIAEAIEDIEQMKLGADTLRQPLSATKNIGESLLHAKYLLEANAYIINVLRQENLWDNLPDAVRQASLWIAMNKGNTPEEGLQKAKEFLRAYHAAPRALKEYEDAYNAFKAAPSDPALKDACLKALAAYQMIARIDPAIYDRYVKAIEAYAVALALPAGEPAREDTIAAALKEHDDATAVYRKALDAYEKSKESRDPNASTYRDFLNAYINGMSEEDRKAFLEYRRKCETVTEIHGHNVLDEMFHRHGLFLKPAALEALSAVKLTPEAAGRQFPEVSALNGSYHMNQWLQDGHREFADEPLRIVLGGNDPARDALIEAYIKQKDVTYIGVDDAGQPVRKVYTAEEAFRHVSFIRSTLQRQSEGEADAFEILDQEELFKDPIESSFRGMLESVKDMWAGDWVDKGKVIVGVVAAVWLLRHIWKRGGEEDAPGFLKLAKYAIVGLPLLMVANSAYKSRTGRDILGENLLFLSKNKRESILEQWRRRSAEYGERYEVLTHPAGFAAMQTLMSRDNPIAAEDLHKWRMTVGVREGGGVHYSNGHPENLDISQIMSHLGANGTEEEAYRIAFLAYEALCIDVAALNGYDSGDSQNNANWGADYIFREYVLGSSYEGVPTSAEPGAPTVQQALRNRRLGMMQIMMNEAQLAAAKNSVDKNETVIERLAIFFGWSKDKVKSLVGRAIVTGEIELKKTVEERLPAWWGGAKEWAFETYDEVEMWFRVRYPYAEKAVIDNFWYSWEALKGLGVTIVETAPGVIKFVVNGAIDISAATITKLKEAHDYILLHDGMIGELHMLQEFEKFVLDTFGYDFKKELTKEEAEKQFGFNLNETASFYDGGMYSPIDGKGKYSISQAYRGRRARALTFGDFDGADFVEMKFDESKQHLTEQMDGIAMSIFEKKLADLKPSQQRYVLEVLQANLFKNIATHPNMKIVVEEYNRELNDARDKLDEAVDKLRKSYPETAEKMSQLSTLRKDVGVLLEQTPEKIGEELTRTLRGLESERNNHARLVASRKEILEKLADKNISWVDSFWLNFRKRQLDASIPEAQKRSGELLTRVNQLFVYRKIAENVPMKDRINWAGYDTAVAAALERGKTYEIGSITVDGALTKIQLTGADALTVVDNTMVTVEKYLALEDEIKKTKDEQAAQVQLVQALDIRVQTLEQQGVAGVNIETAQLFDKAATATTLTEGVTTRATQLLGGVFKEPGSLFGIKMTSVFGEAGEIAQGRVEKWINDRLEYDQTYRNYVKAGKDLSVTTAYERYLANVGLNTVFMRAMIKEEGYGEKQSPLHLSYDEAQDIDEYLEEQERLVSFASFLEIWDSLASKPEKRKEYLP